MSFICSVAVRIYSLADGKEATLWIGIENLFITVLRSFLDQTRVHSGISRRYYLWAGGDQPGESFQTSWKATQMAWVWQTHAQNHPFEWNWAEKNSQVNFSILFPA